MQDLLDNCFSHVFDNTNTKSMHKHHVLVWWSMSYASKSIVNEFDSYCVPNNSDLAPN